MQIAQLNHLIYGIIVYSSVNSPIFIFFYQPIKKKNKKTLPHTEIRYVWPSLLCVHVLTLPFTFQKSDTPTWMCVDKLRDSREVKTEWELKGKARVHEYV